MSTEREKRVKVSPVLQLIYIACSFTLMTYFVTLRMQRSPVRDKITPIQAVTPKKINEYGVQPNVIHTGMHINSFSEFDIVANRFTFTGIVWFMLYPPTASLEALRDFTLERGAFTRISEPAIQIQDKKMIVKYDVEGTFTSPLNYQDFPIDAHRLYLVLLHRGVSSPEVMLTSNKRDFIFKPQLANFGWKDSDTNVHRGIREAELDMYTQERMRSYPSVVFSVDVERNSTRYLSSVLLPLLVLVYLATFTFSVSFSAAMRMSGESIAAIVAYRFVIENMSPDAGYFMLSDYFFLAALVCTFSLFILNIFDKHVYPLGLTAKHTIMVSTHLLLVGVTISTLFL